MLKLRVITAVVLAAVAAWAFFLWTPLWLGLFLLLAAGCCAWEWSSLLNIHARHWKWVYTGIVCVFTAAMMYTDSANLFRASVLIIVLCWMAISIDLVLRPVFVKSDSVRWGLLLMATPILVVAVSSLLWIRNNHGPLMILFIVGLVAAADIGAYFCGRRFGRRKLAPLISAGKTIEGAIGGVSLAMLLAVIAAVFISFENIAMPGVLFFALVAAVYSIAGDLFISRAKRAAGVKDSGHLLPGHGGVLDRFDGLLASVPWMAFALLWL